MDELDPYEYELPETLIAQEPATDRTGSRALFVERGSNRIVDGHFSDLLDRLRGDECFVVNDTRVIPARVAARRETGARLELFLLRPEGDPEADDTVWHAWVSPARKLRPPETVVLEGGEDERVDVLERCDSFFRVRFGSLDRLRAVGEIPLPPYIRRESDDPRRTDDLDRYQTVFSRTPGAVAAPTAGLHFSKPLLTELAHRGIPVVPITLHVGPGTFQPITADRLADHRVDPELYEVSESARTALTQARRDGRSIIAVGTTSTRTLESLDRLDEGPTLRGETSLTILPGHQFQHVDGMVTNFHLPRSSLLVLVSAFHGHEPTRAAYQYAVEHQLRFYSYGDAMVIQPPEGS